MRKDKKFVKTNYFALVVCAIVFISGLMIPLNFVAASEMHEMPIETYRYPIDSSSPTWAFLTIAEKREQVVIPDSVLSRMTEKCLYQTLVTYPFLCDIQAFTSDWLDTSSAIHEFSIYCSAYQEIMRRGLSISSLYEQYGEKSSKSTWLSGEQMIVEDAITILVQEEKQRRLGLESIVPYGYEESDVYTPRGTAVLMYHIPEII